MTYTTKRELRRRLEFEREYAQQGWNKADEYFQELLVVEARIKGHDPRNFRHDTLTAVLEALEIPGYDSIDPTAYDTDRFYADLTTALDVREAEKHAATQQKIAEKVRGIIHADHEDNINSLYKAGVIPENPTSAGYTKEQLNRVKQWGDVKKAYGDTGHPVGNATVTTFQDAVKKSPEPAASKKEGKK